MQTNALVTENGSLRGISTFWTLYGRCGNNFTVEYFLDLKVAKNVFRRKK